MTSIECFDGLPIEYEKFLIEKYKSYITTCHYIDLYVAFTKNYMLVYENNNLCEILIFGNKGNTAICFNSLVDIDQNIITSCIQKLFERYPSIQKIKIVASYKKYTLKRAILYSKSENNILNLPSTMDAYYKELGSHTRKNIRNRQVRLLRDYGEVNFITKYGQDIDQEIINKILLLNVKQMKRKGLTSNIDATYIDNTYKYAQIYGCVAYIEVDGVISAGCIATILNNDLFLHVTTYDPDFSGNNVGELCVVSLIQNSIETGITAFHFLWGESELKKRLLAKSHVIYSYILFKSYSMDYIFSKVNIYLFCVLKDFKGSKYSKPLRSAFKFYQKRKWKV